DQREAVLVGNHEDDAVVVVLQDEGVAPFVQARQHDVTSLDQANRVARSFAQALVQRLLDPRTRGIDDRARAHAFPAGKLRGPLPAVAPGGKALPADQYARAAARRVERVHHDQSRIIHAAIGVDEAVLQIWPQSRAVGRTVEPHGMRPRQEGAPREVVIEKQPDPDHPARAQLGNVRHDKARRPGDMAGDPQQDLALGERLGDQAELVMLEIAQPAVDQLRGRRRSRRRQIVAFDQYHRQPAASGVARDADAVDAAADHQQVVDHFHASGMRTPSATPSPPGRFDAAIVPPWNSAIRRATNSPSPRCGAPVPPASRMEIIDSNRRVRILSGSSGPLLVTVSTAAPPASSSATRTGASPLAKSTAFSTSLSSSWAARSGAPSTSTLRPGGSSSANPVCG